jgi:predicted GNAT superfamily acetyltransferase
MKQIEMIELIEDALNSNPFPGETKAEQIYRMIHQQFVTRREFQDLEQFVDSIDRDWNFNNSNVEEFNDMYHDIKEMYREITEIRKTNG